MQTRKTTLTVLLRVNKSQLTELCITEFFNHYRLKYVYRLSKVKYRKSKSRYDAFL